MKIWMQEVYLSRLLEKHLCGGGGGGGGGNRVWAEEEVDWLCSCQNLEFWGRESFFKFSHRGQGADPQEWM